MSKLLLRTTTKHHIEEIKKLNQTRILTERKNLELNQSLTDAKHKSEATAKANKDLKLKAGELQADLEEAKLAKSALVLDVKSLTKRNEDLVTVIEKKENEIHESVNKIKGSVL